MAKAIAEAWRMAAAKWTAAYGGGMAASASAQHGGSIQWRGEAA
jgi:hypothetical protein